MANILAVEDDPDIRELMLNFLRAAGHDVVLTCDGVDGITKFQSKVFDLLILDIMMPKVDGYAMLEMVRQGSNVPVIIVSALDAESSQLKGYELQADDYVTKPFSMQILIKKIDSILRRASVADTNQNTIQYKCMCLDLDSFRLYVEDIEVEVTLTEFNLVKELLQSRGRVLSRDYLLDAVWGYHYLGDSRLVDTHIKNLRKKIPTDYIETVRGVGYRIDKETQKKPDA